MLRCTTAELRFHDYTAIRNGQLYEHAQLWEQGNGDQEADLGVGRAIEGDRHGWQPRLIIDARLPVPGDLVEELHRARESEDEGLKGVWAQWSEEDLPFDRRFLEEALAYGPAVLKVAVAYAAVLGALRIGPGPRGSRARSNPGRPP